MNKTCQACGARCCRYFCFQIDTPASFQEFENIRWYLMHEAVTVHIDAQGDWYISIANRCKPLDGSNRCRQYHTRPLMCRRYDTVRCEFTQGGYRCRELFTTPAQVERYARKRLGPSRYTRIRAAAYARAKRARAALGGMRARRSAAGKRRAHPEPLTGLMA